MKKIIRLTESDLHRIIERSVSKILREGVLGNDWRQDEDDVLNNYEPFGDQIDRYDAETEFRNQHDWGAQGEEDIDPTEYDPDAFMDYDDHEPTDNELYHHNAYY